MVTNVNQNFDGNKHKICCEKHYTNYENYMKNSYDEKSAKKKKSYESNW